MVVWQQEGKAKVAAAGFLRRGDKVRPGADSSSKNQKVWGHDGVVTGRRYNTNDKKYVWIMPPDQEKRKLLGPEDYLFTFPKVVSE